jgi:hypothetical protein
MTANVVIHSNHSGRGRIIGQASHLNPSSRVLSEKLTAAHMTIYFSAFYRAIGLLP